MPAVIATANAFDGPSRKPARHQPVADPSSRAFAISAVSSPGICPLAAFALTALIDHVPERPPARQLPLTAACTACSKSSANPPSGFNFSVALHVPEYSFRCPAATARQLPLQPDAAFAADQAPCATTLRFASTSVHVPRTVPAAASGMAV